MKAAKELLGDFQGILITDRHGGYNGHPVHQRQICWAHVIRNLERLTGRKIRGIPVAGWCDWPDSSSGLNIDGENAAIRRNDINGDSSRPENIFARLSNMGGNITPVLERAMSASNS